MTNCVPCANQTVSFPNMHLSRRDQLFSVLNAVTVYAHCTLPVLRVPSSPPCCVSTYAHASGGTAHGSHVATTESTRALSAKALVLSGHKSISVFFSAIAFPRRIR